MLADSEPAEAGKAEEAPKPKAEAEEAEPEACQPGALQQRLPPKPKNVADMALVITNALAEKKTAVRNRPAP